MTLKAVPVHDETCTMFITNSTFQFCAGVEAGGKGEKMHFDNVMKLVFINI